MSKFKLGIIQPRISYYVGGGEKFTYFHSKLLPGEDFEVYLYTTKPLGKKSFLYEELTSNNIKNLIIREFEILDKYKFLYEQQAGEDRSRWDIESLYFSELIYPQLEKDNLNAILNYYVLDGLFKPRNVTNILYLLGYTSSQSEYWKSFFSFYDMTISISSNVKEKWSTYMNEKSSMPILGTGVNLPSDKEYAFDSKDKNLVFAGRLIERKGILTLLAAVKLVKQSIPNIKLHILGDGLLKEKVTEEIKNLGLLDSVVMHGMVEDPQMYFKTADICVFPSHEKEGLMGVVMEAMICGKAVITTTNNGNEDLITNNESGILVNPKDVESLANEIIRLINDPSLRTKLGEAALKHANENLLWDKHIQKFKSLLTSK